MPDKATLNESARSRAARETRRALATLLFQIPAGLLASASGIIAAVLPSGTNIDVRVLVGAVSGGAAAAILSMLLFCVLWISTPTRQRDEARAEIAERADDHVDSGSDPVAAITEQIEVGERLLAKTDDPAWEDFQRDHALNEWVPAIRDVMRTLAPRYYYWSEELNPEYSVGPPFSGTEQLSAIERYRLQVRGRVARLRDIRDRLLAHRPGGHPAGIRETNLALLADVLMDARASVNRLMQEGRLDALEAWEANYRRLLAEGIPNNQASYFLETGFRSENWAPAGDVDAEQMKFFMERSLRLIELVHRVPTFTLKPGFDPKGWAAAF